jgi:AbrB family looped-hinge helix DNA binding protein
MALPENVVNVGPQGRIVIPARLRRELGLGEGTRLAVRVEGGRLILEPREEVLRRARGRYMRVAGKRRLSDELIRERRSEARRESAT